MRVNIFQSKSPELLSSKLFDQDSFYEAFVRDLNRCKSQAIIESPFITSRRLRQLLPVFKLLRQKNVQLIVDTRSPEEYDEAYRQTETLQAVIELQQHGAKVLYTAGHHRKLAIVDRQILWEGSLNILSQNDSCEMMRRIESRQLAKQMTVFLNLKGFIASRENSINM